MFYIGIYRFNKVGYIVFIYIVGENKLRITLLAINILIKALCRYIISKLKRQANKKQKINEQLEWSLNNKALF